LLFDARSAIVAAGRFAKEESLVYKSENKMNNWTLLQMLGGIPGQREIFEDICRKVVRSEHPGAWSPREYKGDDGIDILVGDSKTGVNIYQVKFFREGVGDSQRAQIRESYDRILEAEDLVKSWTLMLPLELSIEEMRWFKGWKMKKDHDIRLVSGFQLEEKLKRTEYKEALSVLSSAFSLAGLQIKWFERPTPILKVAFGITNPFRSESHKLVHVNVALDNVGARSVRNPRVHVHYSEPGIATPTESPIWKRVPAPLGLTSWNPRILETNRTIRPSESIEVLPILYPLARFQEIGIYCKLLMDDETPVQSGVSIAAREVPQDGWKEKLGEENFFPVLHPCPTDPDPNQNLSPGAREILNKIIGSETSNEGNGIILIHGFPSNNEVTRCVFSLTGGNTVGCRRDELARALGELIQVGFIMELDRDSTRTRYKLIERQE